MPALRLLPPAASTAGRWLTASRSPQRCDPSLPRIHAEALDGAGGAAARLELAEGAGQGGNQVWAGLGENVVGLRGGQETKDQMVSEAGICTDIAMRPERWPMVPLPKDHQSDVHAHGMLPQPIGPLPHRPTSCGSSSRLYSSN